MPTLPTSTVAALLRLSALEATDWGTVLEQVLRIDCETLGVDRVSYWSIRHEPPQFFCDLGYDRLRDGYERGAVLEERFSPSYFESVQELQLVDVEDVLHDPRTAELKDYLAQREIGALLDVPIWSGGAPVGVLCHEHVGSPRKWTGRDREFALAVGQILTAAIEARERSRAELAERRSVFLHQTATVLGSTLDIAETQRIAVRRALPTLGDAAILDLLVDHSLHRAGLAHVDPTDEARMRRVWRRFPPTLDGPHLASAAIRLRATIFLPAILRALEKGDVDEDYGRCLLDLRIRSAIAVPMHAQNRPVGAMVFYTRHRPFEHADVRLAEEYVALVAAALEDARLFTSAQRAIRARDDFISLASHELRTPLTSLRASAQALASGLAPPAEITQAAAVIVRQADRLDRLAQRMIDTVEVRSGAFSVHREPLDLAELVRDVTADYEAMLRRNGCELELRADRPVVGDWDEARVRTVVNNLLDNAIRFGRRKPIEIQVMQQGGSGVLAVRDHGPGLPPHVTENVFARYDRGVSTNVEGGLGLGLYVVRGIVRAHGGRVRVVDHQGDGASIIVELPLVAHGREDNDGADPRPDRG